MDPETLLTFLFRAPPRVHAVELLGSWDNFTHPYPMHHDRRRGQGFWSGCFKFHHIIFDGLPDPTASSGSDRDASAAAVPVWNRTPRSGGLKQGGVYWYFYRLDYSVEAYDDARECTADCPLMPGQTMNFLEVPREVVEVPGRCQSACEEGLVGTLGDGREWRRERSVQTLEPGDKFAVLEPPRGPVGAHGRCVSDWAVGGRLERGREVMSPVGPEEGEEEAVERPPSKRRRSDDRPVSRCSRVSETSLVRSCRYGSLVDAYATESPVTALHPDPLKSAPVDPVPRGTINAGFEGFVFDLVDTRNVSPVAEDGRGTPEDHDRPSIAGSGSPDASYLHPPPTSPHRLTRSSRPPSEYKSLPDPHSISALDFPPPPSGSVHQNGGLDLASPPFNPHQAEDLYSPTFSAATLSSNGGGANTPFRLSAGYSRDTTANDERSHEALDEIAERLTRLGGEDGLPRRRGSETERVAFAGYALPEDVGDGRSLQSLGRKPSSFESMVGSLATGNVHQATSAYDPPAVGSGSMVEDIFSELGYLGASIT